MNFFKRFVVGFVILGYFVSAQAGLDDEMRKTFNSMVNTTDAGSYNGQSRGVITGGNVFVRNKITQTQLFTFRPPSLKAGCGGVDFFGGSFGFINAQQFQELLQSIASNALGYAFQLGINILCPTCAAEMKELQNRLQQMSQMISNSCEMGSKLINEFTPLKELSEEATRRTAGKRTQVGEMFDTFVENAPNWMKSGGKPTNANRGASASTSASVDATGNIVWKAINRANVSNWYAGNGANSAQLHQIMMSLTGTIIMKMGFSAEEADEEMPNFEFKYGPLGMDNFLFGGLQVEILGCDDPAIDKCLNLTTERVDIEGMLPKVRKMIMGDGSSPGIIAKLRDKGSLTTLTSDELAFVTTTSPGILGVLRDFAHDRRAAAHVAEMFATVMAAEMAISFVNEMMVNVQSAVMNSDNANGLREKTLVMLTAANVKIKNARDSINITMSGVTNAFVASAYIGNSLKQTTASNKDPLTTVN